MAEETQEIISVEYVGPEKRSFGGKAGGFKYRVPELTFREAKDGEPAVPNPRVLSFKVDAQAEDGRIVQVDVTAAPEAAAAELLNMRQLADQHPLFERSRPKVVITSETPVDVHMPSDLGFVADVVVPDGGEPVVEDDTSKTTDRRKNR